MEKTTQGFMGPVTALAAPDDAAVYDAMGKDGCDVQFIVNTLFVKTRVNQTEVKTVEGQQIVFTKEYSSGQIANWDGVSLLPAMSVLAASPPTSSGRGPGTTAPAGLPS